MILRNFFVLGLAAGIFLFLCPLAQSVTETSASGISPAEETAAAAPVESQEIAEQGLDPADAAEQEAPPVEVRPVSLKADNLSYDQAGGTYEASGDVVVRQGAMSLTADHVLLQSVTQDIAADGAVQIRQDDDSLSGERIHYNLATGVGQVRQGRVFFSEKNFHLAGEDIVKTGAESYSISDGRFTTCDGEEPDWEFSAEQIDVNLGRYATARNAWFKVNDIPLLYFPYIAYPVKSERESGLLTPRFGHSSKQGTKALLAWYQVIDRNQDATIYLDHFSEKGTGTGLEYRYFFGRDNPGRAKYYHISGISETPDLYALEWEHAGTLPGNVRLTADVQYVNDKLFFEDFGEVAEDYNRDMTLATVIGQRNWHKLNLAGHMRYLKDLEGDDDLTLQKLPELSVGLPGFRIGGTPLYAGLESSATRFRSEEAEDGERLFLRPSISAAFKPGSWLEVSPEIALTQRFYKSNAADNEVTIPAYALTLSSRLQRVFAFRHWGMDSIKHSIEPQVAYVYVPEVDQKDLPFFTSDDRIAKQNRIEYALINRLTAKMAPAGSGLAVYREIFNLRLSQSYDVSEAREDNLAEQEPFSDLRVELTTRPTSKTRLKLDSHIAAHNDLVFNRLTLEAGVHDGHGNHLRTSYSYRREDSGFGRATDYLNVAIDTAMLDPVFLHLEERYDFRQGHELEKVVGLEYRSRCWSFFLVVRDRPDDDQIMVNFVLAGLSATEGFW